MNEEEKEHKEKWIMFKNYMHNELGITKDDIRQWIQEAVENVAYRLVKNEWNNFDVDKVVRRIVMDSQYFGSTKLSEEIRNKVANELLKKFKLVLRKED